MAIEVSGGHGDNDRQARIVDQMITMHALLRDDYNRRALFLNCSLMFLAALLCALVFVGEEYLRSLCLDPRMTRNVVNWASVLLFALTIVESRVDWASKGRSHDHAVRKLFRLKSLYRPADVAGHDASTGKVDLADEYRRTMDDITPIPEGRFNGLKARHVFKVELSRRISANPKVPVRLLALQLRIEGLRELWGTQRKPRNE